MDLILPIVLNVINSAAILFLITAGLFIIYGLMGIVNLAHGEFIMLGAFVAVVVGQSNLNPWLAIIIAPVILAILCFFIEKILIRHLYGKIMESILATWGLGILIRQITEWYFGKGYQPVNAPMTITVDFFGITYPLYRLLIIALAIIIVIALIVIERKTSLGTTVRAVIANESLASTLGININKVYTVTFVVGGAFAGLAGAIIAPLVTVYPSMGLNYIITSFLAVLVGGVGSVGLAGSTGLFGTLDSTLSFSFDPILGSISIVILSIFIMRYKKVQI